MTSHISKGKTNPRKDKSALSRNPRIRWPKEISIIVRGSPKRGNGVSIVDSSGRGGLAFFVPPRL